MEGHLSRRIGMRPADRAGKPGQAAMLPAVAPSRTGDMLAAAGDIVAPGGEGADRTARETGPLDA